MIRVLDLFAGAGGFTLAGEMAGGFETVAFCEIDKHAQKVLRKNWPSVPVFGDVTKLRGDDVGHVGLITGGFPCQDVSLAGKQKGTIDGERSSLFGEILRLASETGRSWLLMENVEHLISGGDGHWFGAVLSGLAEIGYDAEWHVLPASYIGACHRRSRVWIIAYPREKRCEGRAQEPIFRQPDVSGEFVRGPARWRKRSDIPQPRTIGANDGFSGHTHRNSMMGNAIVPQVAALFMAAISQEMKECGEIK